MEDKSFIAIITDYSAVEWEDKTPKNLADKQWSRQPPVQNHTLLSEVDAVTCFFKNFEALTSGINTNGPLHMLSKEKPKDNIIQTYYVNAFYRGDLGTDQTTVKIKSEFDTEREAPVLNDLSEGVDYLFRYEEYTLALDPFTSTIPKMEFNGLSEKAIESATKTLKPNRNHLTGKKSSHGYNGYAGLLDLSYYESETDKHVEWKTRLANGLEYSDFKKDQVLEQNIHVVAVYKDKNFYLFGRKGVKIADISWGENPEPASFISLASEVGNNGK